MSVLHMSEEEKNELRKKHRDAIKKDREDRAAMNGTSIPKEKKTEETSPKK